LLAFFVGFVTLHVSAQNKKEAILAVAFYNVENLFDIKHDAGKNDIEFTPSGYYHYTDVIYKKKLHNVATVLQQLGTDAMPDGAALIGLAEVENDKVLNALITQPELKKRNYKYLHYESADERGIDVALLYNPKYFRVLFSEPLHVSLNGYQGKSNTRDVLHVKGVLAGDTVHVFVNHFPSRRENKTLSEPKRIAAATVNKKAITTILNDNPSAKILLLGDFNDNPTDKSIRETLGAVADKNTMSAYNLYNPYAAIYISGIGTEVFQHTWYLFDQIMLSKSFTDNHKGKWHYNKATIFKKDFLLDHYSKYNDYPHRSFKGNYWINGYSDHFPVVLYFTPTGCE
jgi:predicted extracellular nuclease